MELLMDRLRFAADIKAVQNPESDANAITQYLRQNYRIVDRVAAFDIASEAVQDANTRAAAAAHNESENGQRWQLDKALRDYFKDDGTGYYK